MEGKQRRDEEEDLERQQADEWVIDADKPSTWQRMGNSARCLVIKVKLHSLTFKMVCDHACVRANNAVGLFFLIKCV